MLLQSFHPFSSGAISPAAGIALHASLAAFLIAAVLALCALFAPGRMRMKWADWTGLVATVALAIYFGIRFVQAGTAPLGNYFEVIAFTALGLAVAYFVATRLKPMPALGGFAFPAIAATFMVSLLAAGDMDGSTEGAGALTAVHVLLTVLANGVFVMAAVAAAMFLVVERALRKHSAPPFVRQFPPLESLRKLIQQCLWIGLPLLTIGLILGFSASPSSAWLKLVGTPKVMSALVLWLIFVVAVAGRSMGWLHGRRHSWLVLAGFALVVLTYAALGLFTAGQSATMAGAGAEVACRSI